MKKTKYVILLIITMVQWASATENFGLIPRPNEIETKEGNFKFNRKTNWIIENNNLQKVVMPLMTKLSDASGFRYMTKNGVREQTNSVIFISNKQLEPEGYKIDINSKRIKIEASTDKGFFYALKTIQQLLPAEINSGQYIKEFEWTLPCLKITDVPRFGYRGFMLDVSRYFMPKKDLLRLIDLLAYHKINYLHLHLIDDNGWRLEIKKYPKLTDIGAWRVDRLNYFSMRTNPESGEPTTQGGYYTQGDVREIVKYAQDRFIEIIPEIEMPAHTNSSLAAFPGLACPVVNHYIGVLPGIGGKNASTIYCAGNDSVFDFLEDVLTEVFELFPSKYIHIGGDEANKENWKKCPKCQARMKANNIPNEEELQSYFIKRINRFILSNGKNLMGWDELVESEIPEKATIFGWRGMGTDAETAGKMGFKYIKSPAMKYYFIRYQGPQWFEPYTYFGNTTLKDVYDYEPLSSTLPDSIAKNMFGIESCLWTEFVNSPNEADYLIFPRLAAFAESAWTLPKNKNWNGFINRLDNTLLAYNHLGVNYALSMFNLEHMARPVDGKISVQLSSIRPDISIRYTLDGSEPDANSSLYKNEFTVNPGITIRASAFLQNNRVGKILPLHIINNKAVGASVLSKTPNASILTNGIRGSEKMSDGEWLDLYDTNAEFTISFSTPIECSQVRLGMLINSGMCIQLPENVKISISDDGINYSTVYEKEFSETERFQNGIFKHTELYKIGEQKFKHIRINVKNPGICPSNHVRMGDKTRIAIDEVLIN